MDENNNTNTSTWKAESYGWDAKELTDITGAVKGITDMSYGPMNRSAGGEVSDKVGGNYFFRKNTKNYDNFKYFLEGIDATDQNLDQLTPFIPGIARLYFHKTPYFMVKAFPELTDNFRSYIETGFKAVSGINDLTATEATIEGGWANQKIDNISAVTDDTNQIEVTLYEQTGSPVREFIETWLTGMRDPRSGVAHYHGYVKTPFSLAGGETGNKDDKVTYSEKNHTGEFIYVLLDPTAQFIEYACLLAHVWPKNVPKTHLNYTSGDRNPVEMQLQFSCIKYEGKYINDIAAYYIARSNLMYNYLNFNPYRKPDNPYFTLGPDNPEPESDKLSDYMSKTTKHAGTDESID